MNGRRIGGMALGACLFFGVAVTARAETFYGNPDWNVTFTEEKKMESSFKNADISDTAYGLQPGDSAVINLY